MKILVDAGDVSLPGGIAHSLLGQERSLALADRANAQIAGGVRQKPGGNTTNSQPT